MTLTLEDAADLLALAEHERDEAARRVARAPYDSPARVEALNDFAYHRTDADLLAAEVAAIRARLAA